MYVSWSTFIKDVIEERVIQKLLLPVQHKYHPLTAIPSPNVLFHTTSDSQPSPNFPLMPLEIVTLEDEEEPVSSSTGSHTSTCRKKLIFAEVSL